MTDDAIDNALLLTISHIHTKTVELTVTVFINEV